MKSARRCQGGSKNTSCKMTSCINQHKMEGMQMNSDTHFAIHRACAILNHIKIHTHWPLAVITQDMRWDSHIWFPTDFLHLHVSEVYIVLMQHISGCYPDFIKYGYIRQCQPRTVVFLVFHMHIPEFPFFFFFFYLIKSVIFSPPKFTKDQDFSPMPLEL